MTEKGTISIHTENIFPIIKKFLYSDHEIFLRELVSNAVDASTKLQKLASLNEFKGELGELKINITFDKQAKTITISDRGVGMTADEIQKYINQIAFSGAAEFLEKYQTAGEGGQIIGHFGMGFYSAFMVANKVEIITKSYKDDAPAARWVCEGNTEFEISPAEKADRGTDIILHVAEDSEEFLDKFRLKGILTKYCKFLPIEIYLGDEKINNTQPLWTKAPSTLNDEDYINFYKELYPFAGDPLFWIHLNVEYPFNLTGILYFPKVKNDFEVQRDKIQLYSRQVFITDEVKDVVPEFLMLLHGVIDSPDIPLNVSRSYLQSDRNVKLINTHIAKKVADKLQELFNTDRKVFEEKWHSVGFFVKYGMVTDTKFAEKAKSFALVQNIENQYFTLNEYKAKIEAEQKDKNGTLVYLYANDPANQYVYIQPLKDKGYDVLKMDQIIDAHFIGHLEHTLEKSSFKRVDSDIASKLIEKDVPALDLLTEEQKASIKKLFEKVANQEQVEVKVEPMNSSDMPATATQPEFMRRMKDMSMGRGMDMFGGFGDKLQLSVNANHPLTQRLLELEDDTQKEQLARHIVDLSLIAQNKLHGEQLSAFVQRSLQFLN